MTLSSLSLFFFLLSTPLPSSAHLSSFFLFFFISPEPPPLLFFLFLFFFSFFSFPVTFSAPSLSLFFSLSLPLGLFFSPPRPLLLRSAVAVEFSLTDEAVAVEISDSDLPLFFFSLRLWIPCDCDYGWVGSFSSSFLLESFVLILGIFFKVVLGGGGGWWRVVPVGGGGGLCLGMVVAGCALYGGVLLKVLSVFFFFSLFCWGFLDLEFVGGSGDCGCSLWQWL